jgi:4-hydroxy-2-oxoheptanedioate aldolase
LSPAIFEIIGLAGFDFVWIDMEHSTADFSTVEHLCRAADAVEMESLVRVPDKHPSSVLRALEAGAGIVNVPQVETAEEAAAVVNAAKYAPVGQRGFCNSSRGTRYGFSGSVEETFAAANERVVVMAQIESVRGVQNAEAICSVPGLDIVFVGSADLSQSLGVVGQFDHPLVLESTRQVLRAARACGKTTMMLVESVEKARPWLDEGTRIFCCGVDIPVFGKTLLRVREAFDPLGARRD